LLPGARGVAGGRRGEPGQRWDRPAPAGGPALRLPECGAALLDGNGGQAQLRGDPRRRAGDGREAGLRRRRRGKRARHGRQSRPDDGYLVGTDGLLDAAGGPATAGRRTALPGHELLDGDGFGAGVLAVVGPAGASGDAADPRAVPPRLFPHRCRHLLVVRALVVLVPASTGNGPVAAHARGIQTIRGRSG
jgi:hypothetical protein